MTTSPTPLTLPDPDAAQQWLVDRTHHAVRQVRRLAAGLKERPRGEAGPVLADWDELQRTLSNAVSVSVLFSEVHPVPAARSAGEAAVQDLQRLDTELGLDRELFEVFAALDPQGLDAPAERLLARTLRDFRRSGVDREEPVRERLRQLQEQAVLVGQEFARTIRDDVRQVRVPADRLAGMPADWLDAHPAGPDGLVTVTTDYPDSIPARTFCTDAALRRELTIAFLNIGWPDNDSRLRELFAVRAETAELLGYPDWADYDAEVKMIGRGAAIPEFIDTVAQASLESGMRDRAVLLERLRQDEPDRTSIDAADVAFYTEVVRREQYDVDAQQVRRYFDLTRVRAGLLAVTGRLFGLTYRPAADAVRWHEDVVAYDVLLGTGPDPEPLGRIYLDLHPREGKYKHAAHFDLAKGLAGRQLPEGVLVCNFPRGLMEHDQVVTLFHEFGHLLHHVLSGRSRWTRFSGVSTEWDFVEAPSQMLEEWAWDPQVLATFAVDEAGAPIPADLVARMRRAHDFGKGYQARTQMFYAAMSYAFHVEQPADLTERTAELQQRYSLFPYIPDTHMPCSFGHLEGYSSGYYTYMWSLVIAKDLFSAFDPDDLFAPEVAGRYRDIVLAAGGSRDAADLVEEFLGRPYTVDAYRTWLAR